MARRPYGQWMGVVVPKLALGEGFCGETITTWVLGCAQAKAVATWKPIYKGPKRMHVMMRTCPKFRSVILAQDSVTAEVAARDPFSSDDQVSVHNPRTGPPCYRTWIIVVGETQLLRYEREPTIHLFPNEEWNRQHGMQFPSEAVPSLHLTEDTIHQIVAMGRV